MVPRRDNLREEAFKVLLEDVDNSPSLYNTKADQESRIAALIAREGLQIKKANATNAITPTAGELRSLLIAYISGNGTPYKGVDVFKAGSHALNSGQLSALRSVRPQTKLHAIEAQNRGISAQEVEQSPYCYCRKNNGQELIKCSNESCDHQFYHLECVNLETKPTSGEEWFCPDCTLPEDSSISGISDVDGGKARGKKRSIDEVPDLEADTISAERNAKRVKSTSEGDEQNSRVVSEVGQVQAEAGPADTRDMISQTKQDAQTSNFARSDQRSAIRNTQTGVLRIVFSQKADGGVSGSKRKRDDGLESDQPRDGRGQGNPASSNVELVAGDVEEPQSKRSKTSQQASDLHNFEAVIEQESAGQEAETLPSTANAGEKVQSQPSQAGSYPDRLREIENLAGDWQRIRIDIQNLAAFFFEGFALDKSSVPPLAADPSADLERLYQTVFGDWRHHVLVQEPTFLRWTRVLQGLIGASLYERILSKPVPWQTPRQLLEQLRPWHHSYDRLLRFYTDGIPGGFAYVVWQAGMNVLDDGDFVKEKIEPLAQDLGKALLGDIKSHLQQVIGRKTLRMPESPDFWPECLETATDLCRLALLTRGRLDAAPHDYEFYWVLPGAKLVQYWSQHIGVGTTEEVVMCILPGIKFVDRNGELSMAVKAQRSFDSLLRQIDLDSPPHQWVELAKHLALGRIFDSLLQQVELAGRFIRRVLGSDTEVIVLNLTPRPSLRISKRPEKRHRSDCLKSHISAALTSHGAFSLCLHSSTTPFALFPTSHPFFNLAHRMIALSPWQHHACRFYLVGRWIGRAVGSDTKLITLSLPSHPVINLAYRIIALSPWQHYAYRFYLYPVLSIFSG
ncbi:uncharacterized protein MYCFIDRAFT_172852 [Pseudocercospora fijiensis CIRAD86]|uniref:Zinc finger PHD-type domain-containing protein n=1 Tax=Pseudocercospora fijiensis (strain CIRAD86) TaxID=383855 RepID=M3B336_PSEFD|nr:uncharacterized protein MYCFIDRAFT_172852 [Pseudocercospora fijiensis CIRAD86]EME83777.1 hypothetical protein MYCFIDRAFT_172852 [Pseudocercospora fijiensis CIRAD86]